MEHLRIRFCYYFRTQTVIVWNWALFGKRGFINVGLPGLVQKGILYYPSVKNGSKIGFRPRFEYFFVNIQTKKVRFEKQKNVKLLIGG